MLGAGFLAGCTLTPGFQPPCLSVACGCLGERWLGTDGQRPFRGWQSFCLTRRGRQSGHRVGRGRLHGARPGRRRSALLSLLPRVPGGQAWPEITLGTAGQVRLECEPSLLRSCTGHCSAPWHGAPCRK